MKLEDIEASLRRTKKKHGNPDRIGSKPRENSIRPECPECGGTHSSVTDSRPGKFGGMVTMRRIRQCTACTTRWSTMEVPVDLFEQMIMDKDAAKQQAIREVIDMLKERSDAMIAARDAD